MVFWALFPPWAPGSFSPSARFRTRCMRSWGPALSSDPSKILLGVVFPQGGSAGWFYVHCFCCRDLLYLGSRSQFVLLPSLMFVSCRYLPGGLGMSHPVFGAHGVAFGRAVSRASTPMAALQAGVLGALLPWDSFQGHLVGCPSSRTSVFFGLFGRGLPVVVSF